MNLQELLNKKSYPPLAPGVHDTVIKSWTLKTTKNEKAEVYVQITFAPANNLDHEHNTALFAGDINTLQTFINNCQRILNKPGATGEEILNDIKGQTISSTYEVVQKDGNTYHNWYLGYVRPSAPVQEASATSETPPATPPKRKQRA